ncbi:uncharacterized protein LOC114745045 isoform X1 [Neltuma alba]|uniref:uncharacterized protein LOC114745045 isoform X1 n=1 Tax=Neltuma alba TaxID=207710 RepID=UPI0010A3F616|nr:uncharacterized protein LOC114745045 isoform X1 [Prosopis alba]XP_028789024.1 uncharacterized protein LOC114745045 isoform X1 [Prosopis alba]
MLLAVEGGGFFSASASGYSKGLTLLLLGQRSEDKPMRVSPLNQYQLVDKETDPELQLASAKNRLYQGCASFVCFGRTSGGLDTKSPLKVGPAQQHDVSLGLQSSDKGEDRVPTLHLDDGTDTTIVLKSSLKKPPNNKPVPDEVVNEQDGQGGKGSGPPCPMERKVQWTDAYGSELVDIREFEPR